LKSSALSNHHQKEEDSQQMIAAKFDMSEVVQIFCLKPRGEAIDDCMTLFDCVSVDNVLMFHKIENVNF